ncbi:MAG: bifunctional demethylmenaquinone methyltransferase/2-methoxy-6-polyprenyl-1,4-benzoquinol methylase UbiE [Ferruginibacter sp.]|nr:bifunctional demethylmenaquinone methyltransferase/2-methoxy-6-polyprenyl-1,4-benzoquinol methylase UbiE [Ferruginibacter sp.]
MAKFEHDNIVPYKESELSKKTQVANMFDSIAHRYDFLNRFLSVGIDVGWRKKAIAYLKADKPQKILDVATGTADVAILMEKILHPHSIVGIDISDGMLDVGRKKIEASGLNNTIQLLNGDSAALQFNDNTFDAVTVSFGVRNFEFLEKGLTEILRVLKPNGKLVVLEFSKPKNIFVKTFYNLYMKVISPNIGRIFSKNKTAYAYLDKSIQKFPEGKNFIAILESVGFKNNISKPLSLGICSIYCGTK